jgi:hypothetical protein
VLREFAGNAALQDFIENTEREDNGVVSTLRDWHARNAFGEALQQPRTRTREMSDQIKTRTK